MEIGPIRNQNLATPCENQIYGLLGRKLIGRNPVNLIVGWCGRFLFFVVPRQFSQDIGEWPENQILIPDWTNFNCPGATLASCQSIFFLCWRHPKLLHHPPEKGEKIEKCS